jgi:hypothetical protein
VASELAEEAATGGRMLPRYGAGGRRADIAPERIKPVSHAGRPGGSAHSAPPACAQARDCLDAGALQQRGGGARGEVALRAWSVTAGVAETLLDQTRDASAYSAEVALRFQFKRRGWPPRTRAQARRARPAL